MLKRDAFPIALTIAGSDSGGGAGIQADLKTFLSLGVHGVSAITCITSQNPRQVLAIDPCRPKTVQNQLDAVFAELPPAAVKIGMLFSAATTAAVAGFLEKHSNSPLVVDPMMVSTSGVPLVKPAGLRMLLARILPRATLLMPNLPEAELITGARLRSVEDLRRAARAIRHRFGCAVLVKGGHLKRGREAIDIFLDGRQELMLSARFVRGIRTHGTGCAYSAAVTAYLARGMSLADAVSSAKEYISQAIASTRCAARHPVLDHLWQRV